MTHRGLLALAGDQAKQELPLAWSALQVGHRNYLRRRDALLRTERQHRARRNICLLLAGAIVLTSAAFGVHTSPARLWLTATFAGLVAAALAVHAGRRMRASQLRRQQLERRAHLEGPLPHALSSSDIAQYTLGAHSVATTTNLAEVAATTSFREHYQQPPHELLLRATPLVREQLAQHLDTLPAPTREVAQVLYRDGFCGSVDELVAISAQLSEEWCHPVRT